MDTGTNFSAEPQEDITSGQFGVAWGNRRRGKFQITFLAAYFATGICSLNIYRMAFAVHQLALLLHDSGSLLKPYLQCVTAHFGNMADRIFHP